MVDRQEQFQDIFETLKNILQSFEDVLIVVHDKPGTYYLNTPHIMKNKHLSITTCTRADTNSWYINFFGNTFSQFCWNFLQYK